MQVKDISFPTPQENLLFDDCLLNLADKESQGEYIRFWESPNLCVVLGRIGKEEEDVNGSMVKNDQIPVLRRSSGGGTVLQGPGCLNYSLIISKHKHPDLNDLRRSYVWISEKVIEALKNCGVNAYFKPTSDLATGDDQRKFSGNAQKRGRNFILHHGTILYKFNLDLIPKYLNMPKDIPEYRQGRPHTDFVTNIPIEPSAFKSHLCHAFAIPYAPQPITDLELSSLKKLLK